MFFFSSSEHRIWSNGKFYFQNVWQEWFFEKFETRICIYLVDIKTTWRNVKVNSFQCCSPVWLHKIQSIYNYHTTKHFTNKFAHNNRKDQYFVYRSGKKIIIQFIYFPGCSVILIEHLSLEISRLAHANKKNNSFEMLWNCARIAKQKQENSPNEKPCLFWNFDRVFGEYEKMTTAMLTFKRARISNKQYA